jgi:hypothetical protein
MYALARVHLGVNIVFCGQVSDSAAAHDLSQSHDASLYKGKDSV